MPTFYGKKEVVVLEARAANSTVKYCGEEDHKSFTVANDKLSEVARASIRSGFRPLDRDKFRLETADKPFLEVIRREGMIRVQVKEDASSNFIQKYQQTTGETITGAEEHYSVIPNAAKWGAAITIRVPASCRQLIPSWLNSRTATLTETDVLEINDNAFAWELFSKGFRLGYQLSPDFDEQY